MLRAPSSQSASSSTFLRKQQRSQCCSLFHFLKATAKRKLRLTLTSAMIVQNRHLRLSLTLEWKISQEFARNCHLILLVTLISCLYCQTFISFNWATWESFKLFQTRLLYMTPIVNIRDNWCRVNHWTSRQYQIDKQWLLIKILIRSTKKGDLTASEVSVDMRNTCS